jgi:hypothetical protein
MKRITLTAVAFLVAMVAQSQTIFDQPGDGGPDASGIISDVYPATAVYSADDFTLDASEDIYNVTVYGFQQGGTLADDLSGFSFYLYADDGGVPAGDPSTSGDGIVEFDNLTIGNEVTLNEVEPEEGNAPAYDFVIDLEAANGGPVTLDAGTYWVVAAPNLTFAIGTEGENRWNWFASSNSNGALAQLIDVDDNFGTGNPNWSEINGLTGGGFDALGFTISGENLSVIDQQPKAQFTVYPNPVGDQLNIEVANSVQIQSAQMYDLLGKATSVEVSDNNTINTAQLSSGVYILKLQTSQGSISKKIVKK